MTDDLVEICRARQKRVLKILSVAKGAQSSTGEVKTPAESKSKTRSVRGYRGGCIVVF